MASTPTAAASTARRPRAEFLPQKVIVAIVFVAAMFMSIMDVTIVNVALPAIGRAFRIRSTAVDGVSIAFLVSLAVFMPASGWLGDRFGGKRVLLAAIAIFTGASVLCGLATSLSELVAFRVLQGVGGGMLAPVGTAMLFRAFPPQERVRVAAIIVVPTALAPAIAPVLGGLLVTDVSWRWVFYVNAPIGVAALTFGGLFLIHSAESDPGRFDGWGFLLSAIGLGLFMFGISEGPDLGWGSAEVLITAIVGLGLLVVMVMLELRTARPIIALGLLANRLFRSTTITLVMASIAFFGVIFAVTLYLQDGRGLSALDAGLCQFPNALGVIVGSQLATRVLYWRIGPRRHLSLGLCGIALAIGLMALLGAGTSLWWVRLILFGLGLSMAQVMVPAQAAAFATISSADTGRASTLYNVARQLGGAIGVAALTTSIVIVGPERIVAHRPVAHLAAYHVCFLVASAAALLGLFAAVTIRDTEAAETMVDPRERRRAAAAAAPSPLAPEGALEGPGTSAPMVVEP